MAPFIRRPDVRSKVPQCVLTAKLPRGATVRPDGSFIIDLFFFPILRHFILIMLFVRIIVCMYMHMYVQLRALGLIKLLTLTVNVWPP